MKTLAEWIEDRYKESINELSKAQDRHAHWAGALYDIHGGKVVKDSVTSAYWQWRGMQPKEESHGT
jgi:hypothetical protein